MVKSTSNDATPSVTWSSTPLAEGTRQLNLFAALQSASKKYGSAKEIAEDPTFGVLNYKTLIQSSLCLGHALARQLPKQNHVGLLMPTSCAAIIAFFAIHSTSRVPVLLHVQSGAESMRASGELTRLKTVLTSQSFLEQAGLGSLIAELRQSFNVVFLEDIQAEINLFDKFRALIRSYAPMRLGLSAQADGRAVILFTSGTTGMPKAVALSHANILANIAQIQTHVPFDPEWVFVTILPISHAFGLTGGVLLPILSGMKAVLHPAPLQRRSVLRAIREAEASVLVATDSFAQMYARSAATDDLNDLKYVVLGGERLTEPTVRTLSQKSAAEIIQGYGATECSPVISMNRPGGNRIGTVGTLLPGMEARLDPVQGIPSGANLSVRGPNVMMGYLSPTGNGSIVAPLGGWFDTGDIVAIDADGFITIIDRKKRFAKVGGELVSLDAVEMCARGAWPESKHAAIILVEDSGREIVTLATDRDEPRRSELVAWSKAQRLPVRLVPERIVGPVTIPVLPTGKTDYSALRLHLSGSDMSSLSKPPLGALGSEAST